MNVAIEHRVIHLLKSGDIVHDPDRTSVCGEDQIVLTRMDENIVDRNCRQIHVKFCPISAAIIRDEQSELGSHEKQICVAVMFANDTDDAIILRQV